MRRGLHSSAGTSKELTFTPYGYPIFTKRPSLLEVRTPQGLITLILRLRLKLRAESEARAEAKTEAKTEVQVWDSTVSGRVWIKD